jgi:cytochrome b561
MTEVLKFLGVLFLVIQFWRLVWRFFGRPKERPFKHWLDDSHD